MSEQSKDKKSWRKAGCIWLIISAVIAGVLAWFDLDAIRRGQHVPPYWRQLLFSVIGAALLLGLWWLIRWPFASWRNFRRTLVGLATFATLAAVFYTEENWRGKRAWESCKRELEAKGVMMDWKSYIPPSVPEDQNFFAAPKMQKWFVKPKDSPAASADLPHRLQSTNQNLTGSVSSGTNLINTVAAAKDYLAWSDQFEPDFNLMRQALKRPYARMAGDYTKPDDIPIPNFVSVRAVAQVLSQRAHCCLLLNQPAQAVKELTLVHDMCRLLEGAPTGKPMVLVSAMINVAVTGLYNDVVAEGLRDGKWQEAQLIELQRQLEEINLTPFVAGAFECEPAAASLYMDTIKPSKLFNLASVVTGSKRKENLWDRIRSIKGRFWDALPRGWVNQNMANFWRLSVKIRGSLFDSNQLVTPANIDRTVMEFEKEMEHAGLFNLFSAVAIPNYSKATQTFAFNQTKANEARVVCALERYRLAHGNYPETLDALVPQFIGKLPQDIIGGQHLRYRRTGDGKFLLYSVGWNETDDGGVTAKDKSGNEDRTKGDWVWKY